MLPGFLYILLFLITIINASDDDGPYFALDSYDSGNLGRYPIYYFKSSDIVAPRINIMATDPACHDGNLVFLSPRSKLVAKRGLVILDTAGQVVYAAGFGNVYNVMVQEYKGKNYITFWLGSDSGGHGQGFYYMLDETYAEVRKIEAGHALHGDLHEFLITDKGTAIIIAYQVVPYKFSTAVGDKDGNIWDCIFQEIDIETGEVFFEWRSSDHISVKDSYINVNIDFVVDYFHMNSVEKDAHGNYLISARYTNGVYYINGATGDVIWTLGGKNNNFEDLSEGKATNFATQHHARWHDNQTTITLFDNEGGRALRILLDAEQMTAELLYTYLNPQIHHSISQGSAQVLPSGNILVGFGAAAAWTEFSPTGSVLCDYHFGPANSFNQVEVESYRVMKFPWKGFPDTLPYVKVVNLMVFVSWNGATEVKQWIVQDSNSKEPPGRFYDVKTVNKTGFETAIELNSHVKSYVRVAGVDADGNILGTSPAKFVVAHNDYPEFGNLRTTATQWPINSMKLFNNGWSLMILVIILPLVFILWLHARRHGFRPKNFTRTFYPIA